MTHHDRADRDDAGATASTSRPTPEAIWDAITKPEWTESYGYGGRAEYDLRPGGSVRRRTRARRCAAYGAPEVAIDGEVVEADPPRKLVQTWRMLMDDDDGRRGLHAPDVRDRARSTAASRGSP